MQLTQPRLTVTMQDLEAANVEITYDDDRFDRRVVSVDIGTGETRLQLLDDIEKVAAIFHRGDVLLQARLQTGPVVVPAVARDPAELAGEWVFTLQAAGHRQRLRLADLQALYRDIDRVLSEHRKATEVPA